METIDKIQNELKSGELNLNPRLCNEYIGILAGEMSFYIAQSSEIEKNRPHTWLKMRQEHNSDTATDRSWERTEDGVNLNWYNSRIKRIKSLITGLKALVKNAENEHNF